MDDFGCIVSRKPASNFTQRHRCWTRWQVLSRTFFDKPRSFLYGHTKIDLRRSAQQCRAVSCRQQSIAGKHPKPKIMAAVARELIARALAETGGNQLQAAKLLGITRATLRKRMEKFGITKSVDVR